VSSQLHSPAALPGERATGNTLYMRLGGPRAGLDEYGEVKILTLPVLKLRPLGRPASSLYVEGI
jgi:hypothetical protein